VDRPRVSVAGMMSVVPLAAVGFLALRSPSDIWAILLFSTALSVLACTTLAALLRRGHDRACWIGFSLFGWIYLYFGLVDRYQGTPIVTQWVVDHISRGNPTSTRHVQMIVHSLGTIAAGVAGSFAAIVIAPREATFLDPHPAADREPRPSAGGPRP